MRKVGVKLALTYKKLTLFKVLSQKKFKKLTLSLSVPRWASDNTDLPLNSNISKVSRGNIALIRKFSEEYSINFLIVCRLMDFALVLLNLLMFKVCGIIAISKI